MRALPGRSPTSSQAGSRRVLRALAALYANSEPRERARQERLEPGERPVPARHEDLACVAVEGVQGPLDHERGIDGEQSNDETARALRDPGRLDVPRIHRQDRDPAPAELDRRHARERELSVL